MKKRGISAVVATILIILIVVVGVGIVWKIILPLFAELELLSYSDVRMNIVMQGYTIYDKDGHFAFVQIGRGADEVNVTGLEIGFRFDGTTKTYQTKVVPAPGGKHVYKFNFTNDSDMGIPQDVAPDKVTVAPVFIFNNKVRLGQILDEKPLPSGKIYLSAGDWINANLEAAENIVVIHLGPSNVPGVPVNDTGDGEGCIVSGEEICGNDVDEDCENGVDDGCDVLGYFFEGTGVEGDAYVIENCYQLQNMSYNLDGYYELKGNIDCSMTNLWGEGKGFKPVGDLSSKFTGRFDGNDFEISELFINRGDENYVGLFGYIRSGEIKNVGMVDSEIYGNSYVGGITGSSSPDSTITNSYNTGSVNGRSGVGGIVGISYSSITDSYNTGSVQGYSNYIGGIAGDSYSPITNSYNTGSISSSSGNAGGIAGSSHDSTVTNSYNTGSVVSYLRTAGGIIGFSLSSPVTNSYNTGSISGLEYVGGVIGVSFDSSPVTNSYNTGSVTGSLRVGGIIGASHYDSTVTNSYNTGSVTGSSHIGGIIGASHYDSTVTNSYNTGSVTGSSHIGGIIGSIEAGGYSPVMNSYYLDSSCGEFCGYWGKSLTSLQMKAGKGYNGWDFDTIWDIDEGTSYPWLGEIEQVPHPGL